MKEKPSPSPEFQQFNRLTALLVSVPKGETKEKPKSRERKRAKRKNKSDSR